MGLLAVFSRDPELRTVVRRVMTGRQGIVVATSWERLLRLVRERPVSCAILDDHISLRAGGLAEAVGEMKASFPSVGCVVVARPGSDPHAMVRLGRARVENLVLVPQDALDEGLTRELTRVTRFGTVSLVSRALTPYLPARECRALRLALEAVHQGQSTEDLAECVGLTRPHMSERLKAAGLPSAGHLLVWARLLHAGRWLPDPARSAESVSRQLEYSSGAAFRRALKNYTGATPTEVIDGGGVFFVLEKFLSACTMDRRQPGADQTAA